MKYLLTLTLIYTFCSGASANENSKADALLQNVDQGVNQNHNFNQQTMKFKVDDLSKIKIDDAFLAMLFTEWKSDENLPQNIKTWFKSILEHDFKKALKNTTAIETSAPSEYAKITSITKLYLLYKLGLSQTFFDGWLELAQSELGATKEFITLDQTVALTAVDWFYDNAITLSENDKKVIAELDGSKSLFISTSKVWASLRDGRTGLSYLKSLPRGHKFILPLSTTVILDLARTSQLATAGYVMKNIVEPEVMNSKDPRVLSRYYLLLGRLLYQAKAYDAAEEFYRKIPNSVPEYVQARVEMAWLLIRKNDQENLRGELASLETALFKDSFLPELHLLWAVSNLKLCRFPEVKYNFNNFVAANKVWVSKVNNALKPNVKVDTDTYDIFIELYKKGNKNLSKELTQLKTLVNVESETWKKSLEQLESKIALSNSQVQTEYTRYWNNRKIILSNTVRKMRFVKVEMMTRQAMAKTAALRNKTNKVAANQVLTSNNPELGIRKKNDELRFPHDGVIWPDELFRLKSDFTSHCVK